MWSLIFSLVAILHSTMKTKKNYSGNKRKKLFWSCISILLYIFFLSLLIRIIQVWFYFNLIWYYLFYSIYSSYFMIWFHRLIIYQNWQKNQERRFCFPRWILETRLNRRQGKTELKLKNYDYFCCVLLCSMVVGVVCCVLLYTPSTDAEVRMEIGHFQLSLFVA